MIRVEKVTKDYTVGQTVVHALRGVSLAIGRGEFLSIAGPSGSGKTTLLNLIGCLDKATSGEIYIAEEPVSGKNRKELALLRRQRLGFVFQSFNLIPVLSAYENVSFALSLLGVDGAELEDRTNGILAEVGLQGMETRLPGELSGGQQQRVAVARALIKEPDVVLADEPTANLDSETGREILELMLALNEKHGTTFVFSTHDRMVMEFGRRLIRLHDGQITADERRES
ncbi:MAG: ABC transporter ATP-binding protein [Spirochaetales bacterium]|nr:ABC transporter ATP-binding protein [Spirochaetales bacterium]